MYNEGFRCDTAATPVEMYTRPMGYVPSLRHRRHHRRHTLQHTHANISMGGVPASGGAGADQSATPHARVVKMKVF